MNTMNSELQLVKQLLNPATSQLTVGGNENINSGINLSVFLIAKKTRAIMMPYALKTSAGNIHFYGLMPVKFNDPDELNPSYKSRVLWQSFSFDSQQSSKNERIFFNQNAGIVKTFLTPSLTLGDKTFNNPYNKLTLTQAKLHQYLVPNNLDTIDNAVLTMLKQPFNILKSRVLANEAEGLTGSALVEMNTIAYDEYLAEVENLYTQGLLTLSTIVTTPKVNSIALDIGIDETMDSQSNPFLSANFLLNQQNINLSALPVTNNFRGLIQVTEADMSALLSDNTNMFGKRLMNRNAGEGELPRFALSKVGMIKDFGTNTPVLVSIIDTYSNNINAKTRVDTFESYLERGTNLFIVEGSIKPIARQVNSNSGRSGNVFFEISIDTYSPYNSTSLSNSIEYDDFADLTGFDVEETHEVEFSVEATETVTTESSSSSDMI